MREPCTPEEYGAHTAQLRRLALQISGALCLLLVAQVAAGCMLDAFIGFFAVLGLDLIPWLDASTLPGTVINALFYIAVVGTPGWVFFKLMKHPTNKFTESTPCGFKPYLWTTLISIGASTAALYITLRLILLLEQWGLTFPAPSPPPASPAGAILSLISLAILPALLEELLFRGMVLRGLAPYGKALALTVSSLAFGLIHCSVRQIPCSLAAGFCIGFFVLKYNNFRLGVTTHFINNALVLLRSYAYLLLPGQTALRLALSLDLFFILAGSLCALWVLWREKHPFSFLKERSLPHTTLAKVAFSPLFLLLWGLCLLLTLTDLLSPLITAVLEELL